MKNKDLSIDTKGIAASLSQFSRAIFAYRALIFFLVVASIYGFIVWRINNADNTLASQAEETSQTLAQPHIDPATIQKIQSLQDNSVSVQALFNQARDNPFQE